MTALHGRMQSGGHCAMPFPGQRKEPGPAWREFTHPRGATRWGWAGAAVIATGSSCLQLEAEQACARCSHRYTSLAAQTALLALVCHQQPPRFYIRGLSSHHSAAPAQSTGLAGAPLFTAPSAATLCAATPAYVPLLVGVAEGQDWLPGLGRKVVQWGH